MLVIMSNIQPQFQKVVVLFDQRQVISSTELGGMLRQL